MGEELVDMRTAEAGPVVVQNTFHVIYQVAATAQSADVRCLVCLKYLTPELSEVVRVDGYTLIRHQCT